MRVNVAVRLLGTDRFVGRLEATIQGKDAELAYSFDPEPWGCGYASEAVGRLERHCFEVYDVGTFLTCVAPANMRSIRLLAKAGYVQVGKPATPTLTSYDDGDLIFAKTLNSRS